MFCTWEETTLCLSCNNGRIPVNSDTCLFFLHDNLMFVIARKLSSLDFCCVTSIYSILFSLLCCSEENNLCRLEYCYGPPIPIIASVISKKEHHWTLNNSARTKQKYAFFKEMLNRNAHQNSQHIQVIQQRYNLTLR